jgi:hypothetical protein
VYSGANFFYLRGSSSFIGSIDNVSVKEYITATNTPRLDYSTGSEAFLLEPQSTNLIPYSEDFSYASWSKIGSSLTSGFLSPSGDLSAFKLVESTNNGNHILRNNSFTTSGETTISIYAKAEQRNKILLFNGPAGYGFDLLNGTTFALSTTIPDSFNITELTNGWYKCCITNSTANRLSVYILDDFNSFSYTGDGVSGVYVFGAQVEQQSYATSYIPTSGASATRNQELCNNATPVINSEEGTLYAEIATLANDGARQISISSGSNNERLSISYNTNGRLDVNVRSGGVYQVTFNYTGVVNPNIQNKIALKYKLNDFALWVNGVEVATDSSGITPIGLNVLNFSSASFTSENFFGNTKDLKYYPKALADVQLQDLTTI